MPQFDKVSNSFQVPITISSDSIVLLVLLYLQKHPKVKPETLNVVYVRNIVKEMLAYGGLDQLQRVPPEIYLKKQDLMIHLRGIVPQ